MRYATIIAILSVLAIAVSLGGCTGTTPAPTASVTPTPEIGHALSNPAPQGQTVTGTAKQKLEDGSTLSLNMTLEQVVAGDEAAKMLRDYATLYKLNLTNAPPQAGNEFLFARFKVDLLDFSPNTNYSISNLNFAVFTDNGMVNATPIIIFNPTIQGDVMKGQSRDGWVLFDVPQNSTSLVIAYARTSDGSGGLWFRAK